MSDDDLYDHARAITDSVLGAGTYDRLNRDHPDPGVQAAIARGAQMNDRPPVSAEHTPQSRLARLCDVGLQAIKESPEFHENDKIAVLMDDEHNGGMGMWGFDDPGDSVSLMLLHIGALMNSIGRPFKVMLDDSVIDLSTHVWGSPDD